MIPRFLFDENLAPRLVRDLADLFPDSTHVRELGLQSADDETVWRRAAAEGFIIVTRHREIARFASDSEIALLVLGRR